MSISTHPCVDSYTPDFRLALAFRQSYVEAMTYPELERAAKRVADTSSIGGFLRFPSTDSRDDAISTLMLAVIDAGGGDFKNVSVQEALQIMKKAKEKLIREDRGPTVLTLSPAAITEGQAVDEAFDAPEGMVIAGDLAEEAMVEAMAKGSVDMLGLPPQFVLDVRRGIPAKTLASDYNVTQNQAKLLREVVEGLIVQLHAMGTTAQALDKEIDELLTFEVI